MAVPRPDSQRSRRKEDLLRQLFSAAFLVDRLAMKSSIARVSVYLSIAALGCGPPEKHEPAPSETESEEPQPFDEASPSDKILMGAWGTLIVPKEFRDDPSSAAHVPEGAALDIVYSRRDEYGIAGRLTIAHEDKPQNLLAQPDMKNMPGDDLTAVACPGGSVDTGEVVVKKGAKARIQCATSSRGGGIVAVIRQGTRLYDFVCVERGADGITKCIQYLKTFEPG
jgi:hypothetical protein